MSLNWSLEGIENYKEVCWDKFDDGSTALSKKTEALIWATIVTDIGKITEDNAEEFLTRLLMWETATQGGLLSRWNEEENKFESYTFTLEDIKEHIGLSTNVKTESKQRFHSKLATAVRTEVERRVKKS